MATAGFRHLRATLYNPPWVQGEETVGGNCGEGGRAREDEFLSCSGCVGKRWDHLWSRGGAAGRERAALPYGVDFPAGDRDGHALLFARGQPACSSVPAAAG